MVILNPESRYLFDTTVFIDILRNRQPATSFYRQTREHSIFAGYSIITETELWRGLRGTRTAAEHKKLLRVYHRYPINVTIARNAGLYWQRFYYGEVTGDRVVVPTEDCLIAATAKFYDLRLLTRDSRHMPLFKESGIVIDNYTTAR